MKVYILKNIYIYNIQNKMTKNLYCKIKMLIYTYKCLFYCKNALFNF